MIPWPLPKEAKLDTKKGMHCGAGSRHAKKHPFQAGAEHFQKFSSFFNIFQYFSIIVGFLRLFGMLPAVLVLIISFFNLFNLFNSFNIWRTTSFVGKVNPKKRCYRPREWGFCQHSFVVLFVPSLSNGVFS